MSSVVIADFKYGVDRRRPRVAAVPGTLWAGVNVQISRGGDIERVKKFVPRFSLPDGTFGMAQVGSQLFVFGSADLAALMPNGVQYQRLQAPSSSAMKAVLKANAFDGKMYVIAEYVDGNIHHFYNGTRISTWDSLADTNSSVATLSEYLARKLNADPAVEAISFGGTVLLTASVPGVGFSLSTSTTNGSGTNDQTAVVTTVQANVAAIDETRATGSVTVTGGTLSPGVNSVSQVTVNAVALLSRAVDWVTSNSATANALAVEINNNTSAHGYSASAVGPVVTLQAAPGTGASRNGHVVAVTSAGNVTASKTNIASGADAVAPVAQISKIVLGGTYEATDTLSAVLNGNTTNVLGRASGHGTFAFVYKRREYFTANSLLRYTKLNDASDVTDATISTGAGFINIGNDSEGDERLVAIEKYQNLVALFSRQHIRIYDLSTDASLNTLKQPLDNSGTLAPRSVLSFASTDILYLDETGIRSLQVRDLTGGAFVSDFGSAIDPLIAEWIAALTEDVVERAVAIVEPIDGRYWLAIGPRIYVLSYFPSSKINAWSYCEPGFSVTDFCRVNRRVYARDDRTIYLYGGTTGNAYPDANEQVSTVELPFVSAGSPSTFKNWESFDIGCEGAWKITFLLDPTDETKTVEGGIVTKTTYQLPAQNLVGESPMFAVKLVCSRAGNAKISNFMAHFAKTENS